MAQECLSKHPEATGANPVPLCRSPAQELDPLEQGSCSTMTTWPLQDGTRGEVQCACKTLGFDEDSMPETLGPCCQSPAVTLGSPISHSPLGCDPSLHGLLRGGEEAEEERKRKKHSGKKTSSWTRGDRPFSMLLISSDAESRPVYSGWSKRRLFPDLVNRVHRSSYAR